MNFIGTNANNRAVFLVKSMDCAGSLAPVVTCESSRASRHLVNA
jgi:hypothetical protein